MIRVVTNRSVGRGFFISQDRFVTAGHLFDTYNSEVVTLKSTKRSNRFYKPLRRVLCLNARLCGKPLHLETSMGKYSFWRTEIKIKKGMSGHPLLYARKAIGVLLGYVIKEGV